MKTIAYRTIDKSLWGPGPWMNEPDKKQWQDKATGLPCLIVRNGRVTGALCGYVGVTKGHPLFGKQYENANLSVHGGITFSNFCHPEPDETRDICHVVEAGEDDKVWWLGFDCAHAGDLSPALEANMKSIPAIVAMRAKNPFREFGRFADRYRTIRYVKAQCEQLAQQLAAMKKKRRKK
jgi:hypothetical protein